MIRLPSALALGLAIMLAPVVTRAETAPPTTPPPKPTPTPEQRMVAREHYEKAVGHFNNDEYIAAAEEFLAVHQAVPQPALLYNAAQSYRLGGDVHKALEYYRAFLVEAPKARQRADVERHIKELEAKATVAVKNVPPDMAAPPAAAAAKTPTDKPGGSDRLQGITAVIKQNRAAFRACFDKWSRQHPGVNGRVTLTFYLDPDGNLDEPNADEKGFAAPEVAACIEDVSQKLRYPQSASGKFTRFTYPFDFKAAR